ncbi:MAG: CotH kinase family protein [Polyangiaceae bacterium]|nr:CotH kinase family protein [Polyangiaceae bacterium]
MRRYSLSASAIVLTAGSVLSACGGGDETLFTGGSGAGSTSAGGGGADTTSTGGSGGSTQSPVCKPTGGGPHWLLETETVSFQVECISGLDLPGTDFDISPLPSGATYNPDTQTFTFTPGLDQAQVYNLTITVKSTGETGTVKVGVADHFLDPANVPVKDPILYTEEYGLPVLFLSPPPPTEDYSPATVIYKGHTYTASAKLRGAASLWYPKNSYTIEFDKEDKFDEPDEAGGFKNKRKIVLISTFDDNSYVRQRLAYDLWNRLDKGHLQIQTYSAVVYINGQYFGLYTVSDHIDGFLMEDHGYDQDGNLYKAVNHDANFDVTSPQNGGAPKVTLHDGYVKREGTPLEGEPGAFADLEDLVQFIATSPQSDFLSQIDGRIDRRDFEDWWIFVTFTMADDSAGKNSYLYHDPLTPGGVFRYAPWDFNASFGQTWQTAREAAKKTVEYKGNKLFSRFLAEPTIGDPLRTRYVATLHGLYSKEAIINIVDSYIKRIDKSALRDEARWVDEYQNYSGWNWRNDFTTYQEEVVYLKQWISDRWDYQDGLY